MKDEVEMNTGTEKDRTGRHAVANSCCASLNGYVDTTVDLS